MSGSADRSKMKAATRAPRKRINPSLGSEDEGTGLGMKPVGADHDVCLEGGAVVEGGKNLGVGVLHVGKGPTEADVHMVAHAIKEHALDVAPHQVDLALADKNVERAPLEREARAPLARDIDETARQILYGLERIGDLHTLRRVVARVRKPEHVAAGAECRGALEHDRREPALVQAERKDRPAMPAPEMTTCILLPLWLHRLFLARPVATAA